MTQEDIGILIDYNYWARDRVLEAVKLLSPEQFSRPLGNSFSSVRDTIAHICAAEHVWISRMKGESPKELKKPDRVSDVGSARREWTDLEQEMREQFARLGPEALVSTLRYRDLSGKEQADMLWQVFQHVVNHGTYHRGQVTTMLRQLQAAPPQSMDLIAFYRERRT